MKREDLAQILKEQDGRLLEDLKLNAEQYEEIQGTISSLVAVQNKIKSLKSYKEQYMEDIAYYMASNNLDELYSKDGRASMRESDITSIKKDLVLMVINEFRNGERDSLDFEDISETKSQVRFIVKPLNVEGE